MKIKTEIYQGIFVVTCDGTRLDAAFAKIFFNSLSSSIEKGHTDIILDLSQVKFVDSTGLGAIVRCLKTINDRGYLVLCGVNEIVLSLLKMTHLDGVFLRAENREKAFAVIQEEKAKREAETVKEEGGATGHIGFGEDELASLSMEEGEPILEVDSTERRRHKRVTHKQITNNEIIVYVTNKRSAKRSAAVIVNISASGFLALSPSKLNVGDVFVVEGRIGDTFKLRETAVIRNCREGKYGFEFIDISQKSLSFLHQMTGAVLLGGKRLV